MLEIKISLPTAKKFLLQKQFLLGPKKLSGKNGIAKVIESLRAVQVDPLNPCGRNQDLVFQSRVKNTHPDDYYEWLYQQKKGVEYYDKELCLMPVEDLKYANLWYQESDGSGIGDFLKGHKQELNDLLTRIKKNGPVSSLDLLDSRKQDIWWSSAHWGKNALESLWRSGQLVVAFRKNGRKYYDLPQRIFGKKFQYPTKKNWEKNLEQRILRRLKAVGLLPVSGSGTGWQGMGGAWRLAPAIKSLLNKKKLTLIDVEGVRKNFVILTRDLPKLNQAEKNKISKPRISFLAPLDNLLWDRQMIKDLFAFEYIWEVYTPPSKRKHGYYVLPILFGDEFVGRIELILKDEELLIKGFWLENKKAWNKEKQKAFALTLAEFQRYLRADSIKWLCSKPNF